MENATEALFQEELTKMEVIAGLQHALDLRYRQLRDVARRDWEHLFGEKDRADACVTVRVKATASNALRGSGFLKSRRQTTPKESGKRRPRFAD